MGLQMKRPETPQMKEWQRKSLAARVRRQVTDIEETFRTFDKDGSGFISQAEFISALRAMGVRGVGDTESWSLMQRFRKPGNTSGSMTVEEFKDCMREQLRLGGMDDEKDSEAEKVLRDLEEAEAAIEKRLPRDSASVRAMLSRFDEDRIGDLSTDQLRHALSSLGVNLSASQFKALLSRYDPTNDGSVGIMEFAKQYASSSSTGHGPAGLGGNKAGAHGMAGPLGNDSGVEAHWARIGVRPGLDPVSGHRMDLRKVSGGGFVACGAGWAQ